MTDRPEVQAEFWRGKRVLVTGGAGFLGANLVGLLKALDCEPLTPSRLRYNLLDQSAVRQMFADTRPQIVFHLAGLVGGILANKLRPADYSYQNLLMSTLVIEEARRSTVEKYITLIGGCSYPATAPSPIQELQLWQGYPQVESAPYSLAKRMNVVLANAFRVQYGFNAIVLLPGNVYGPHDNFDLQNSHVIPALIRKFSDAALRTESEVVVWGSGRPVRDFVYASDACEAILRAAEIHNDSEIINISSGTGVTIRELVEMVAEVCCYRGHITWDTTKPDGQLEKVFDVGRMKKILNYECTTPLMEGLRKTRDWFVSNHDTARLHQSLDS